MKLCILVTQGTADPSPSPSLTTSLTLYIFICCSGVAASSFRVVRQLLARIEDVETGKILPEVFYCPIPQARVEQVKVTAEVLGDLLVREVRSAFPPPPQSGSNDLSYLDALR